MVMMMIIFFVKYLMISTIFRKRKHADEFEHLLEAIPDDNIKNKVDACADSLVSKKKKKNYHYIYIFLLFLCI